MWWLTTDGDSASWRAAARNEPRSATFANTASARSRSSTVRNHRTLCIDSSDWCAGPVSRIVSGMTKPDAIVLPFYTRALTVNRDTTSTAVLRELLADDFESIDSHERKTKATLIAQVEYVWKLIPDLKWEPQDVIAAGDKVVVRSVATGSPRGAFMGLQLDGTRSFRNDTTDIHELERGQIARVHHLEGWAAAMKQLGNPAEHCVETATFRVKPGVGDEQLLALERRVRGGTIAGQRGYLSRELAKADDGTWLVIMRFDTRAHADAWMTDLKAAPEMRELGGLIELDTMSTRFFTRCEP